MNVTCTMCEGYGSIRGHQCPRCFGHGFVPLFPIAGWIVIFFFMMIYVMVTYFTNPIIWNLIS